MKQPAGTTYALINSTVKIDCDISGSTMVPLWKINGTIYNIYNDPPNGVSYVPDGLLIHHVSLHWNYTSFQCYVFGLSSTIGYLYVQSKSLIFILAIFCQIHSSTRYQFYHYSSRQFIIFSFRLYLQYSIDVFIHPSCDNNIIKFF